MSERELRLVSGWERARRIYVTKADLAALEPRHHRNIARHLVRKGLLVRVRRGVWLLRPVKSLPKPTVHTPVVLAHVLLHDQPHYIGGLWALSHHGLTEQLFSRPIDAFVTRPHRPRPDIRFHVGAMDPGIDHVTIEGLSLPISDRERTLVDILDHPRIVGGMRRALELVRDALDESDIEKLIAHASQIARHSTCQRLGVLLERHGVTARVVHPLRKRTDETRSLLSLVPGRRSGRVNKTFRVVENDR